MRQSNQTGAVLAVSLIMLAVLTLLGVAAIGTGMTNFKLVGNLQAQKEAEQAVHAAMETYFSTATPFIQNAGTCDPDEQTETVNGNEVVVDIAEPLCLNSTPAPGNSLINGIPVRITSWDIRATVRDAVSGSRVATHWGLIIPMLTQCNATRTGKSCSEI
jgi:Tfp pilus assembly protein PilX